MISPGFGSRANLFHVEPRQLWGRCALWAGLELDDVIIGRLLRYRDWLLDEAIPAGGLGPAEGDRLDRRHIGDSLLFAAHIDPTTEEVWDLGSGMGLPGIPLAIVLPQIRFVLLDRSSDRNRLMRRAIRILGLENAQVEQGDIESIHPSLPHIVTRAVLSPSRAAVVFHRLLSAGGQAVMGGSWRQEPHHDGWETHPVPRWVLDREVWFLIMHQL